MYNHFNAVEKNNTNRNGIGEHHFIKFKELFSVERKEKRNCANQQIKEANDESRNELAMFLHRVDFG